jgi:hypothetical protein
LKELRAGVAPEIYMPARGLFKHVNYKESSEEPGLLSKARPTAEVAEEQFYDAFAKWLVDVRDECTKAISLGGHRFKDKWGTPDVIGVRKSRETDIMKSWPEIVSAEIKTDNQALITAFGQACAYRLFSHKSYIVVPDDSLEEDMERLETLATIFGIGLVRFDKSSKNPEFELRVPASRHEPDIFYANKNLKLIEEELFA